MTIDPLTSTVIDLDAALGGNAELLLGGGFGLYIKQIHLELSAEKTRLPRSRWPRARTTQDIDLFLGVEVVADPDQMARYRTALDQLGFLVEANAKWMKFGRKVDGQRVLLDLMVGPLGDLEDRVKRHSVRVKPRGSSGLHARMTEDALAVEDGPMRLVLGDEIRSCEVLVPQPFSYVLMKLGALRDRIYDVNKDEGRHHALDLYRIAAMFTETEDAAAKKAAKNHAGHPTVKNAIESIDELFGDSRSLGRLRLREHSLCPGDIDCDFLASELNYLLAP